MHAVIRTFRGPDARAALAAVKAGLGPDAVILSTRELPAGLFRPAQIEITAGVGDASPLLPSPGVPGPAVAAAPVPAPPVPLELAAPLPAPVAAPVRTAREMAKELAREEDRHAELLALRTSVDALRRELSQRRGAGAREGFFPLAQGLFEHLCSRGFEEAVAEEAVRGAIAEVGEHGPNALFESVRLFLQDRVVSARAPWLADRRRVIALVGPTGVGKTTTLAKIAARALLDGRQSLALVTVDTYRIGASEQIARYGEIMKVPTFVAQDRQGLQRALEATAGADLVLVDTAGRSLSEAVYRQAEFLRGVPGVQLHLVASAASGPQDLAAVAERYRPLAPERVLLTKLDEAALPAAWASLALRLGRPFTALADGQRVPEDLHAATTPGLIERLTGDWEALRRAPTGRAARGG